MSLILLIEDGVRKPGGLQGDIEYISFNRKAPEKAFLRLTEMVAALGSFNAAATHQTALVVTSPPPSAEDKSEPEEYESWLSPKPEWSDEQFDNALMFSMFKDDGAASERLTEAYHASNFGNNAEEARGHSEDVKADARLRYHLAIAKIQKANTKAAPARQNSLDLSMLKLDIGRTHPTVPERSRSASATAIN
jgi:hypothetical protein